VNIYALRAAQAIGFLWAAPISLVGLLVGAVALLSGAHARMSDSALVFHKVPFGPGGALTLGNVILHTGHSMDEQVTTYACRAQGEGPVLRIGDHERAHVYQYLVLGLLFLPLYFACGGVSAGNRFEQAADRYALTGKGWWPWPRPPAGH
jgi:hypothetical protein